MLSILIPVYNRDCTELLESLAEQGRRLSIPFEIRLYDDGSLPEFKLKHQQILADLPEVAYLEMPQNLGRSKLRNLLASEARYELMIFMDCDAGMIRSDFLSVYLNNFLENKGELYVGGTFYPPAAPSLSALRLHWEYGRQREVHSAAFKTFNFAISKTLFQKVGGFDERLTRYGHEDTMFGIAITELGEKWTIIDNPLEHLGLEKADVFLKKSITALESLIQIAHFEPAITKQVGMLKVALSIQKYGLSAPLRSILQPFIPYLRKRLEGGMTYLLCFDIYRLYFLLTFLK